MDMRKLLALMAGVLLAVGGLAPAVAAASPTASAAPVTATAPYCGLTWGSQPKAAGPAFTPATLTNIRAGRHDCYDRMVVDLGPGPVTGYSVRYVPELLVGAAGHPYPLAGDATLEIVVNASAHDSSSPGPSFPPVLEQDVNVTGFTTFREVLLADPYTEWTTIGLGVRARLPFRTMVLTGPDAGSRLVIDVAHRW